MSVRNNVRRAPVRKHQRYRYIRDLSITYEGLGEEIRLQTPEISTRGMFIHTTMPFPEGAIIKLKFRLNRSDFEVFTRCEVRYCLPNVGIGVEFVDITPEAQRAIARELEVEL